MTDDVNMGNEWNVSTMYRLDPLNNRLGCITTDGRASPWLGFWSVQSSWSSRDCGVSIRHLDGASYTLVGF